MNGGNGTSLLLAYFTSLFKHHAHFTGARRFSSFRRVPALAIVTYEQTEE